MANFSSSSVGSGMGTFRGMMCCFISDWPSTLSILPILMPYPTVDLKLASASYGDKNNPSKRSKKKEISKVFRESHPRFNPNNPLLSKNRLLKKKEEEKS